VFGPTLLLTAVALGAGAVFRPNTANGSVPFGGVAEPAPAPPDQPRESERAAETRPEAPSTKRVEVGRYQRERGASGVLVSRAAAADAWQRLKPEARVFTRDQLVSLPGYRSEFRLDGGVNLTLWGSIYEFASPFLESAVVLHAPPKGRDADFTLDRGAVLLTNAKDKKSVVRIRFHKEVWDVTLEDQGTEIGVGLLSRHVTPYGSGEPPSAGAFLLIRKGQASVRVSPFTEYEKLEPTKEDNKSVPVVIYWTSTGRGAERPRPARPGDPQSRVLLSVFDDPLGSELPEDADQRHAREKVVKDMRAALEATDRQLSESGKVQPSLLDLLRPAETAPVGGVQKGILAVRALGALDAIADVVNVLDDADKHVALRGEAIITLRHWIGRNGDQEGRLLDPKTRSGILTEGKKFRPTDAILFLELLHTPGLEQLDSADYWAHLIDQLKHEKLAIRELAFFHLRRLVPEWQKTRYDPAGTPEARQAAYKAWKELIPDGKLPPTRPK
jgi:hypothetical protein